MEYRKKRGWTEELTQTTRGTSYRRCDCTMISFTSQGECYTSRRQAQWHGDHRSFSKLGPRIQPIGHREREKTLRASPLPVAPSACSSIQNLAWYFGHIIRHRYPSYGDCCLLYGSRGRKTRGMSPPGRGALEDGSGWLSGIEDGQSAKAGLQGV